MSDTFVPEGPLKAHPLDSKHDRGGQRPGADPFTRSSPNAPITLDSSADMFAFVNQGADVRPDRGPYSITPAKLTRGGRTQDITLFAINGTHIGWAKEARQGTGIVTDLRAGVGAETAYVRSVKADLLALPKGTKVVIAGHSLGGIVAQELAADKAVRDHVRILNTVTFGSPPIKPHGQEGIVHRLVDAHDPVPLLSWDAVKSNVASTVNGALEGGQDGINRAADIAGRGITGLFSREMVNAIVNIPRKVGDGAARGVEKSDVYANTTIRDAGIDAGAAGIPNTDTYLSFRAHAQSYNDPQTWSGITVLGENDSASTRAAITFDERNVGWHMTKPVRANRVWSNPILAFARPYLSEADPSQMPGGGAHAGPRLVSAESSSAGGVIEGEKLRAALAMVMPSDARIPEANALGGTRAEQLAAVHEAIATRGSQVTPEQADAVLILASTLGLEHLDTAAAAGPTQLVQADRPAQESGRSV